MPQDFHRDGGPHERTEERLGYAGFKPKTVGTRLGALTFQVPQVRERGLLPLRRKLALAEIYVEGMLFGQLFDHQIVHF